MAEWALSDELQKRIVALASDLNGEVDELRGEYDEQSEKWQDSAKGDEVQCWLDSLDEMVQGLEDVEVKA